jgi:adenylate kinase
MASPPKFIISGAPASGKGTQCEFIKKEFNVVHLSTGDMLRSAAEAGTSVGLEAKEFMDKGDLVPDETIIAVVLDRLKQNDCATKGWLLDGFPRTRAQADALEKAGIECDVFIQLDVDENLLVERVVGRRMDPETGKIYHLKYSPPKDDEITQRLVHRSDDTEEKVVVRIQNYKANLDSIVDKYSSRIVRINGNVTPNETWTNLLQESKKKLKIEPKQNERGPARFIISGAPASGKGTQCEFIKKEFNVVHLSTGDMLRAAAEAGTSVGLEAKTFMDKGALVPDETIIAVVLERLRQNDCIEKGWLLDGFPRTRAQADALEKAGIECDVFIQLDVDDDLLVERVVGRRMDPETGKIYHLKYSPPPSDRPEIINRLVHRSDDTEEKVVVRINNYKNNLDSIVDKYGDRIIRLNGNRPPQLIWTELRSKALRALKFHVVFILGG